MKMLILGKELSVRCYYYYYYYRCCCVIIFIYFFTVHRILTSMYSNFKQI